MLAPIDPDDGRPHVARWPDAILGDHSGKRSPAAPMRFWLSNNDGKTAGPFELRDIRAMAGRGELSPEAQVCIEGGSAWHPVRAVVAEAAAPPTYPASPEAPAVGFSGYAGFGKRFAAFVIDWIVTFFVGYIIGYMIGLAMATAGADAAEAMGNVVGIILNWTYFATMESSPLQATLGKLALGIKVTDLEGRRVGFGRATGRYFAKIISALILMIGFIMAAFTEKRQGLHDLIAGCLVVNK
jgi:uncharacterized RDD family membrane protein YckC